MRYLCFLAVLVCTASGFAGNQDERPELSFEDIPKVMQKVFDQHISRKKMDMELMERVVKTFINQFDKHRIYLLSGEISPHYNMKKEMLHRCRKEYEKRNFSFFSKLIKQFQLSIERARKIRDKFEFFDFSQIDHEIECASKEPSLSEVSLFAQNEDDLQGRLRLHYAKRIIAHKERAKEQGRILMLGRMIEEVEDELRNFENEYLFVNEEGQKLSLDERENIVAFHILEALTKGLDAHSDFLEPEEAYSLKLRLNKGVEGVGIQVQEKDNYFVVSKILKNSPASKNESIKEGDLLFSINGKSLEGLEVEDVMSLLEGKEGEEVQLKLLNEKDLFHTIVLQRAQIVLNEGRVETSFEKVDGGIIGRVVVHSFYKGPNGISTVNDVKKAIDGLRKKGELKGLALDLRDNRGGYLMQAVKVAGLFMKTGVVVTSKMQNGKEVYFRDVDPKCYYEGPLVILTSKVTASAAEIVAQSLQDWGLAIVVGDKRTYGKGSIQMQTVTSKESRHPYKVTVGRYYGVDGESNQGKGVLADVVVPSIFFNKTLGEEYLYFPLANEEFGKESFEDELVDISPEMKEWYIQCYMPHLQERREIPMGLIEELRQKSGERIAHNKDYQYCLTKAAQLKSKKLPKDKKIDFAKLQKRFFELQRQEAGLILKDFIALENKRELK